MPPPSSGRISTKPGAPAARTTAGMASRQRLRGHGPSGPTQSNLSSPGSMRWVINSDGAMAAQQTQSHSQVDGRMTGAWSIHVACSPTGLGSGRGSILRSALGLSWSQAVWLGLRITAGRSEICVIENLTARQAKPTTELLRDAALNVRCEPVAPSSDAVVPQPLVSIHRRWD